jgi:hypothetical protein
MDERRQVGFGITFGVLTLGIALIIAAYTVYPISILFAALLALSGLCFVFAGTGAIRSVLNELFPASAETIRQPNRLSRAWTAWKPILTALLVLVSALSSILALVYSIALIATRVPSQLSPQAEQSIVERLRTTSPQGAKVQIIRDEECSDLADQFADIFDKVGWHQISKPRAPQSNERIYRGLLIRHVPSDTGASLALRSALDQADIGYGSEPDLAMYGRDYFILTISDSWLHVVIPSPPTP